MISICNYVLTESIGNNLKSQGSILGRTLTSSLPRLLSIGGLVSMGASTLGSALGDSPAGNFVKQIAPYGAGMMTAGVLMSTPQRFSDVKNNIKNNYQVSKNQELMRRYQQQNPQYFQNKFS